MLLIYLLVPEPQQRMSTKECKDRKAALRSALRSRNPERVALAINIPPISSSCDTAQTQKKVTVEDAFVDDNDADWSGVLTALHEAHYYASISNHGSYFEAQSSLHSALNHVFGNSVGNWLLSALHTVCVNTYRAAVIADNVIGRGHNDHTRLEKAVSLLQESYSKTFNDRTALKPNAPLSDEGSKKAGVLFIVNQLFSMYFRLNKLRLCKNLIKPVEIHHLHQQGTMGEMVTYRYYVGRLNTFEDQYDEAEKNLEFALQHCHVSAIRNKKRILNYLLPVKLLRGRLPTRKLLQKYSLNEFLSIVEGIRKGDLRSFMKGLVENQEVFIRRGTYLLLEKCKAVCYRNLFKRVYLIAGKDEDTRHKLSLKLMIRSFKWLGTPMDLDEIECILANLIFRGYVKGYISHTNKALVLSKKNPFPVEAVIKS